jgi:molecular chaperone GrpE (heat shock protein)
MNGAHQPARDDAPMNDARIQHESPTESFVDEETPREEPSFGALDIVEAFTAMRHEWRGQTKESRALVELVETAASRLQSLEAKLLASVAENRADDSDEARKLALLIAESDYQLSRAIAATAQWDVNRTTREDADTNAAERFFEGMGRVARWFARPLMTFVAEQRAARPSARENPALEGLNLMLARLRRGMHERGIERIETQGMPFDAETMRAIGTIPAGSTAAGNTGTGSLAVDCPVGHVAEQLSPAYLWHGRLLRFADVRVAN